MCCFLTILAFLGPRAALAIWWIADQLRFNTLYDTFIWPALGFVFLPFTTLMYTLIYPLHGLNGGDWIWIGLAVILDIMSYGGGGYGNRNRIPGYGSSSTPS